MTLTLFEPLSQTLNVADRNVILNFRKERRVFMEE